MVPVKCCCETFVGSVIHLWVDFMTYIHVLGILITVHYTHTILNILAHLINDHGGVMELTLLLLLLGSYSSCPCCAHGSVHHVMSDLSPLQPDW